MTASPEEVLEFWLKETGPKGWYKSSDDLDEAIRTRFLETWEQAKSGDLDAWECSARNALALLIVLDQFPRNMFRGEMQSFETDAKALALAKKSISKGFDKETPLPERQFFYLPMMHSESGPDQDMSVRLIMLNLEGDDNLKHARVHRDVIRQFGRFPYRNDALGRSTTPAEAEYLANGGYAFSMREFAG